MAETTSTPSHPIYKLIGKNYPTPDLVAKATGRRSTPRTIVPRACCLPSCC